MKFNERLAEVDNALDAFNTAVATYMLRNAAWMANPNRASDPTTALLDVANNIVMAWANLKQAMRAAISSQSFGSHTTKLRPRRLGPTPSSSTRLGRPPEPYARTRGA